jgi:hypothetical protein
MSRIENETCLAGGLPAEPDRDPTTASAPGVPALVSWVPDIVFGVPAETLPGLEEALAGLAAGLAAPSELSGLALDLSRRACGEPGLVRSALIKCEHNHVGAFEWRGRELVHKLYGNAWGCVRECAGRLLAARAGLPGVEPPLWVGAVESRGRVAAAAVFPWQGDLPDDPPPGTEREFGRALGRWARRLHDSVPPSAVPERRPFTLRHSRLLDMVPLVESGLAPPEHWRRVEELVRRLLAEVGDDGRALVHNDLGTPGNARRGPEGGVGCVLDFEFAQIGFRAMELLWIRHERSALYPGFVEGYDWPGIAALEPLLDLWGDLVDLVGVSGHAYNPPSPCACRRAPDAPARFHGPRARELFERHLRTMERWA